MDGKTPGRRKIYLVTEGGYPDLYQVLCAFDRREDAEAAVKAGLGDGIDEQELFPAGELPRVNAEGLPE